MTRRFLSGPRSIAPLTARQFAAGTPIPWTPKLLANKTLWLPSSKIATPSAWPDQSGAGLFAPVQATGGAQPSIVTGVNGAQAFRFAAGKGFEAGTNSLSNGTNKLTMIAMCALNGAAAFASLVGFWTVGFWGTDQTDTAAVDLAFNADYTVNPGQTVDMNDNVPRYLIAEFDGTRGTVGSLGCKRVFVNGRPGANARLASSQINYTGGTAAIASNAVGIGCWSGETHSWLGDIYEVITLGGIMSPSDRANLIQYFATLGGFSATPYGSQTKRLMCLGDSITAHQGLTLAQGYPALFVTNQGGSAWGSSSDPLLNQGVGGSSASPGGLTAAQSTVGGNIDGTLKTVITIDFGRNDLVSGGITDTQLATNIAAIITQIRALPEGQYAKILVSTLIDSTAYTGGMQVYRASFNNTVKTNFASMGADGFMDPASDPNLGPNGVASNVTYFQDGTHPTAAGDVLFEAAVRAQIVAAAA